MQRALALACGGLMRNDCPKCWSNNIIRIENQKDKAYCEDCGCVFHMIYENKNDDLI